MGGAPALLTTSLICAVIGNTKLNDNYHHGAALGSRSGLSHLAQQCSALVNPAPLGQFWGDVLPFAEVSSSRSSSSTSCTCSSISSPRTHSDTLPDFDISLRNYLDVSVNVPSPCQYVRVVLTNPILVALNACFVLDAETVLEYVHNGMFRVIIQSLVH